MWKLAILYLRDVRKDETIVNLQRPKIRVAPIKTVSIPRLELCAPNLLAKLVNHYLLVMPFPTLTIHLWSDFTDVLFWLRKEPVRWNTFVANRTFNIQTLLPHAYWHHVGSLDNPADIASRGVEPEMFSEFWLSGPSFLKDDSDPWPTVADDIEIKFHVDRIFT